MEEIMKGKILVTPRSLSKGGHPLLQRLTEAGYEVSTPFPGRQPTEEELMTVLPGCIGYLAGVERVSGDVLKACDKLKVISRNGVGIDNVDRQTAKERGVILRIANGANSRGVAELAISLMFDLIRGIPQVNESVKHGGWFRKKGMEIQNRTLGVIGTGSIGRHVIAMATGLGMKVLGHDPYPDSSLEVTYPGFSYVSLEQVMGMSDVVTLHCPAGEKPLINEETLPLFKHGAYLINTARSALIDQDALLRVLNSGGISGYAVDAFDSEPPELTPLLRHENVVLSSHIGGYTEESINKSTEAAICNILDVLC